MGCQCDLYAVRNSEVESGEYGQGLRKWGRDQGEITPGRVGPRMWHQCIQVSEGYSWEQWVLSGSVVRENRKGLGGNGVGGTPFVNRT